MKKNISLLFVLLCLFSVLLFSCSGNSGASQQWRKSDNSVVAEGLTGSYKSGNVTNGKLKWDVEITSDKRLIFTLYENNKDKDLSTYIPENTEYKVTFKYSDNGTCYFTGYLRKSDSNKLNKIVIPANDYYYGDVIKDPTIDFTYSLGVVDSAGFFIITNPTSIVISNKNGSYDLGNINTEDAEGLVYDKEVNEKIVALMDKEQYQEALELINAQIKRIDESWETHKKTIIWNDSSTAKYYNFTAKREMCLKHDFESRYSEIQSLIDNGKAQDALNELNEIKDAHEKLFTALGFEALEEKAYDAIYWNPVIEAFNENDRDYMHFLLEDYYAYVPYSYRKHISEYDGQYLDYMLDFGYYFGPAGGIVFYDKGEYSDGWRYLEAPLSSVDVYLDGWGWRSSFAFGKLRTNRGYDVVGTSKEIGTGKANTEALIAAMDIDGKANMGSNNADYYAAKICSDYSYGGYDDWFLPSIEELEYLAIPCYFNIISTFGSYGELMSSSEIDADSVYVYDYNYERVEEASRTSQYKVLPIHAF